MQYLDIYYYLKIFYSILESDATSGNDNLIYHQIFSDLLPPFQHGPSFQNLKEKEQNSHNLLILQGQAIVKLRWHAYSKIQVFKSSS